MAEKRKHWRGEREGEGGNQVLNRSCVLETALNDHFGGKIEG